MSQPEIERARAFLKRANADLAAVRALENDQSVPDEIVGFHAQQTAEKLLKSVLASHGIEFPRTHSLRYLIDALADHQLDPPEDVKALTALYPFAVQLRYDAPIDDEPFDRTAARELLDRLHSWTTEHVTPDLSQDDS